MSPSVTEHLRRCALVLALGGLLGFPAVASAAPATTPAFQVDYPFPTADKPQSKLWFARGTWWAVLPRATGPSLWERTAGGWREHPAIARELRGLPGRGDVWADRDGATIVTVADRQLAIIRLTPTEAPDQPWRSEVLAHLGVPVSDNFETATIARSRSGQWHVAATYQSKVGVWSSADARQWKPPVTLGSGLSADDICTISAAPEGVAVIWANQHTEAVLARVQRDDTAPAEWEPPVTIAAGGKTADDHLHATLAGDGTLWLATKNSVDTDGQPQLVLRLHPPAGQWVSLPYAPLHDGDAPSRPFVIATPDPQRVVLGHVVYARRKAGHDHIVAGLADPSSPAVLVASETVIAPDASLQARVNDPTVPKAPFPADGPWILLASDAEGRVYEADLSALRGPQK